MFKFCFPAFLLLFGCQIFEDLPPQESRTKEEVLQENLKLTEIELNKGLSVSNIVLDLPGSGFWIEKDPKPPEIFVG